MLGLLHRAFGRIQTSVGLSKMVFAIDDHLIGHALSFQGPNYWVGLGP